MASGRPGTALGTVAGNGLLFFGADGLGGDPGDPGFTDEPPGTCAGQSFTPATRVLLPGGKAKAIASLKPGDKVLATSTKTGKTQPEAVTAVEVNRDTDLYNLNVKTSHGVQVIHTTSNHLFWDPYLHYAGFRQTTSNRAASQDRRTASRPRWSADRSRPSTTAGCGTSPSPATTTTTSTSMWQLMLRSSFIIRICRAVKAWRTLQMQTLDERMWRVR